MFSKRLVYRNNAQIRDILRRMQAIGRDTAIAAIANMFNLSVGELKQELKDYGFSGNICHISKWQSNVDLIQEYMLEYQAWYITIPVWSKLYKGVNRSEFKGFTVRN
jgi:hypothetical protein